MCPVLKGAGDETYVGRPTDTRRVERIDGPQCHSAVAHVNRRGTVRPFWKPPRPRCVGGPVGATLNRLVPQSTAAVVSLFLKAQKAVTGSDDIEILGDEQQVLVALPAEASHHAAHPLAVVADHVVQALEDRKRVV